MSQSTNTTADLVVPGVSEAELLEHFKVGIPADGPCLCCGEAPLSGAWTDYNGQVYCLRCGVTYQILGSHLRDEYMSKNGLTKADVAKRYCDMFEVLPVARAYWNETRKMARWGMWLGPCPIPDDDRAEWSRWIENNVARVRPNYESVWDWEAVIAGAAARKAGAL